MGKKALKNIPGSVEFLMQVFRKGKLIGKQKKQVQIPIKVFYQIKFQKFTNEIKLPVKNLELFLLDSLPNT